MNCVDAERERQRERAGRERGKGVENEEQRNGKRC